MIQWYWLPITFIVGIAFLLLAFKLFAKRAKHIEADVPDDRNKPFSDMLKRSEIEYKAEKLNRETDVFDEFPRTAGDYGPQLGDSTEFTGTTGFAPGGVSFYGGEPIPRKMKRRKWFGRNK